MKVDFHVHTDHSGDGRMPPGRVVELAVERGLDGIVVCDHNTVEGGKAVREHVSTHAAELGRPLLVIVGTEVKTAEGEIIGAFCEEDVERGMSPEDTVAAIHAQGGLAIVPHPFDRFRRSAMGGPTLRRIACGVDAIEGFNARNVMPADDRKAQDFARAQGIPVVAGSDAHIEYELARAWTELPAFEDAEGLKAALGEGCETGGRRSMPGVHVRTLLTKRREGW